MSSENIGIGSATIVGTWTVATMIAKVPELAQIAVSGTLGAMSVWQLVTAKFENRRNKKQE